MTPSTQVKYVIFQTGSPGCLNVCLFGKNSSGAHSFYPLPSQTHNYTHTHTHTQTILVELAEEGDGQVDE